MSFHETFVAITAGKRQTSVQITLEQSASNLWHDSRKVRITASFAKKAPIRGNPQHFLREHIYHRFHGNAATQHDVESKALAFQWLEGCGYQVTCRGTVLCTHEPWLSASPDGVLHTGELLEIKCPLLKSNESLEDLMGSQKYDVKTWDATAPAKWSTWLLYAGSAGTPQETRQLIQFRAEKEQHFLKS
ncbi:hypothetical protein AOLI_G00111880 [Acnodon oligacanthus]